MKHIIIAGSARSGKTTLAAMLKERFPVYNLFHGDCIREWLISLYGKKRASQIVHSDGYANAMLQLVNAILKDTKQVYIIEWSRLYPSSVEKIKVHDRCTFLFLGHGGLSPEKLIKQCREFETECDFTAELSDANLLSACKRWANADVRILNECISRGETYYNTSRDRMTLFQQIVSDFSI